MNTLIKSLVLFVVVFGASGADERKDFSEMPNKDEQQVRRHLSREFTKISDLKKEYLNLPKESTVAQRFEAERKLINHIHSNIRMNLLPYEAEYKGYSQKMKNRVEDLKDIIDETKNLGGHFEQLDLDQSRKYVKYESDEEHRPAGLRFLDNIKDLRLDLGTVGKVRFEEASTNEKGQSFAAHEDILKSLIRSYLGQTEKFAKDEEGNVDTQEQLASLKYVLFSKFEPENSTDHLKYKLIMLYIDHLMNDENAKLISGNDLDFNFPSCFLINNDGDQSKGECSSDPAAKKAEFNKEIACVIDPTQKLQPVSEEVQENIEEVVETAQVAVAKEEESNKEEEEQIEPTKDEIIAGLEKEKAELLAQIEDKDEDEDEDEDVSSSSSTASKTQTETLQTVVTVLQPLITSMTDMMSRMIANQQPQADASLELLKLQMQNNYMKEMYDFKLKTYENMWDRFYAPQHQYQWRNNNNYNGYNVIDTNPFQFDRSSIDTNRVNDFSIPSFLQASRANPYSLGANSFDFGNRSGSSNFLF